MTTLHPGAIPQPATTAAMRDVVPFNVAVRTWFSVSLRTFGGPAGQIAVMHRELVDDRRWIGEQRFLHALSFCTVLPGPEAQQLAIYLGWLLNGTLGGLVAGILFVLPGYVAIMALAAIYAQWGSTTAVTALFAGLAPAVLAIVTHAVRRIAKRSLGNHLLVAIAIAAFVALFAFGVPFPIVIATAAIGGMIAQRRWPERFAQKGSHGAPSDGPMPLIADDALHGESPSWQRAIRVGMVGLVVWFVPVAIFAAWLGRHHVVVREGLFFSGTAVVTFGGAYAVLSYVAQRAVSAFHWLAPGEMVNGLALAETTPGPLIMVVQYVAFLGAFRHPGTLNPWVAAIIGATLTVWVTFVPCFVFVFLGAPHIAALRHNKRLAAALSGVTAAVVGVIANLSIYFALHTLFNKTKLRTGGPYRVDLPIWSSVNWQAVAVALLAFVLVFRSKLDTLKVLAICGVVGAALHLAFS